VETKKRPVSRCLTGFLAERGKPDAGGEVGTLSTATQLAPTLSRCWLGAGSARFYAGLPCPQATTR
jgi:hypothetical protein